MYLELIATASFGLEAVVRREIENLGYAVLATEDGKVTFEGDERAIVRSNIWLRSSDRVQIKMAEFTALEFEDIFQGMKKVEWEDWIPKDGHFIVNGSSVKSKLSSVPAIQSVAEKALVERLKGVYGISHFEKTGADFDIKVTLLKDRATITLDTTGDSLFKRGYRVEGVVAPLKETMASALVQLSFWKAGRILADPCCGSGTIPIEAAMLALNIAPGMSRSFTAESWKCIPAALWAEERENAKKAAYHTAGTGAASGADGGDTISPANLKIFASDIDPKAIEIARRNAERAGVLDAIHFSVCDVSALTTHTEHGVMITNPPYGERIGDRKSIDYIYSVWKKFFAEHDTWSLFVITADKTIEDKVFGRPADRRRKLYNGRLETCYYQFHGKK